MEFPSPPILPPPRPKFQAYIAVVATATLAVAIYIAILLTGIKQSLAGAQRNISNKTEQRIESGARSFDLVKALADKP